MVAVADIHDLVDVAETSSDATVRLAAIGRIRAWCDGRELAATTMVAARVPFPERVVTDATGQSARDSEAVVRRVRTAEVMPDLAAAVTRGAAAGGSLDVVATTLRGLEPAQRTRFAAHDTELASLATRLPADDFARAVRDRAERVRRDDGLARLERQRRATRLSTWIDASSGMWRLNGAFDPDTGLRIAAVLDATRDALFAAATPETCPSDPLEKQRHLSALALAALVETPAAASAGRRRVDVSVVLDVSADREPVVDWGLDVDLPVEHLRDLVRKDAVLRPIVVRDGVVVAAPGRINLGRTTRLANAAQRRALSALYTTCAVPHCRVPIRYTKPHHVHWWRDGGGTDLDNLVPLCVTHHHNVHDDGWVVELDPQRRLTIRLPNGETMTTGPPSRRAA